MKSSWTQAISLLQQHGLPAEHIEGLHGWSNDVWLTQTHVVRISSGRFRQSFHHEVTVTNLVADRVAVPNIIAHGEADGREWMIAERQPGRNLLDAWPELDAGERDRAMHELGRNLQRLHDTALPDDFANPWQADAVTIAGKAGDAYHVLPKYYPVLIRSLRAREVNAALLQKAEDYLAARMPLFDDDVPVLTHGDIHFNNLIWDGSTLTLLDFEGATKAPRDMELDTIIRFTGNPEQFYGYGMHVEVAPADLDNVIPVLRESYPLLFASADLTERLNVYEAMWQLLQLHHFPPGHDYDPAPRLEALMTGESRVR